MPTLFSKILSGQLPARFVWQEAHLAAFLTIAPLRPGHTLVVPRQEVDQWTDADGTVLARCVGVAQTIGQAAKQAWNSPRVGLMIAGSEVPHLHVHVFPTWGARDFNFANADHKARPEDLDDAAARLRGALRDLGHGAHVPID